MPRDQRLYMTFPIEFPEHPKVKPLTALAKWTFVEMNAYSRRLGLDGAIPKATAHAIWSRKPLSDLVASHPARPLVMLTDDAYVIRDYADHQFTEEDIEELREKRSKAGALGGKAKAQNRQSSSKALASAKQMGSKPLAESESESRSELTLTDISNFPQSSHLPDRAEIDSDQVSDLVKARARTAGITDLNKVRALLEQTTEQQVSARGAVLLVEAITSKASRLVRNVDAYVATACRTTPEEVCQAYWDLDVEGVA